MSRQAKAGVVLQARMGSTRLPGKVLAYLGTRTLLEHCIQRLSTSQLPVIVATTGRLDDDEVAELALRLGAEVYRGDEHDVLARYIGACRRFGLDVAIRATADNPAVDMGATGRVLDLLRNVGADHVVECGLPVGAAVEAVTLSALERARELIADAYDREHVTSFIRRDGRFNGLRAMAPGGLRRPGLRLTVDTREDLDFMRAVFQRLAVIDELPVLDAVIRAADAELARQPVKQRAKRGA